MLPALALLLAPAFLAPGAYAEDHAARTEESHGFPEIEFAASDTFRSASYIQPLWKELHFEGHYFGEETNMGYTGASWALRVKGLTLAPGLGIAFGDNHFSATPAATFRWAYEKKWFVSEGLLLQCFRTSSLEREEAVREEAEGAIEAIRPTISDGSHLSVHWKRVTLGGTWEHIHFREDEWKGGGRLAIRVAPRVSAILYVLSPGRTEFRAGILIHPARID